MIKSLENHIIDADKTGEYLSLITKQRASLDAFCWLVLVSTGFILIVLTLFTDVDTLELTIYMMPVFFVICIFLIMNESRYTQKINTPLSDDLLLLIANEEEIMPVYKEEIAKKLNKNTTISASDIRNIDIRIGGYRAEAEGEALLVKMRESNLSAPGASRLMTHLKKDRDA